MSERKIPMFAAMWPDGEITDVRPTKKEVREASAKWCLNGWREVKSLGFIRIVSVVVLAPAPPAKAKD